MMIRATFMVSFSIFMVFAPISTQADDRFRFSSFFKQKRPTETAVVQLARTLDDLEKKLNRDGTVVAKAPDIWGEARLTKHRQEFEREMAKDVGGFEVRLNAAISRTDQAFLSSALAISTAGRDDTGGHITGPDLDVTQISGLGNGLPVQKEAGEKVESPTNSVIYTTPVRGLGAETFGVTNKEINIEPSIVLDQKARYLNHLHQLRRLNEGDDTADAPGYAMNLVRIPVSLMPGSATQKGHGAEVTITATPHITEELLPTTFRQLVINDLVDLLAPVIRRYAEKTRTIKRVFSEEVTKTSHEQQLFAYFRGWILKILHTFGTQGDPTLTLEFAEPLFEALGPINVSVPDGLSFRDFTLLLTRFYGYDGIANRMQKADDRHFPGTLNSDLKTITQGYLQSGAPNTKFKRDAFSVTKMLSQVASSNLVLNAGSVTRRSREPLSSSQIPVAFGAYELVSIALDFESRVAKNEAIHLSDVRAYLQEELESAYDITTQPDSQAYQLLNNPAYVLDSGYNATSLLGQLRNLTYENAYQIFLLRYPVTNQFSRVLSMPNAYRKVAAQLGLFNTELHLPSVTTSLAWAVVVESVLLNDQLNQDIRRVSKDPECQCMCPGDLMFCGANPDPQARQAFVDYVKCRWPVHVFALDPQAQDQNVADSFSMRREMQLALALAFAGGEISAQNMTRYVRRLELDMETIALNRTAASFGHGRDVFGWRFYPRVQSPPFESNSRTVFRDLLRGGPSKDDLRRSWEIEPGMRECTAVVLMPSFITHMTFDIRGNYFPLGRHKFRDPSDTRTSIEDNMEMSHKIQLMEKATCSIAAEANCYRDGEMQRLMRRADQIGKKLPMQTVHARVPNENYLGGFEMFSAGTTDLAPELLDFYGMPGIDSSKETVFFLVGNNFSVHDTKVLAGNKTVEYDLVSRQVMRVTIPAGVQTVDNTTCDRKLQCWEPKRIVDVHIATPYGVSQHLEIPVLDDDCGCVPTGYRWTRENIPVRYQVKAEMDGNGNATGLKTTATDAKIFMAPPYQLEIATPLGSTPQESTATVSFVVTVPQIGSAFKIQPFTSTKDITASYDATANVYRIEPKEFYILQKDLQAEFVKIHNELVVPQIGTSRFELKLDARFKFSASAVEIPLDNALTMNVELQVVK